MNSMQGAHKILVAEDEAALLKALTNRLKEQGYEVFAATNGEEALELAIENVPDLILLDLNMPKMDGIEFMQELRKRPEGKDTKVIVITNYQADDRIVSGLANTNPSYYLVKAEWSIAEILEKIQEVLEVS